MRLVTHDDCDGLGCAVIVRSLHPEAEVSPGPYDDADDRITRALEQEEGRGELLITDLRPSPALVPRLDAYAAEGGRLRLVDHHRTSLDLAGRPWATIDLEHCATRLCFELLGANERYREFAELVDDIDMFRRRDLRSSQLASLSMILPWARWVDRFTADPRCEWSEAEAALLEFEDRRMAEYAAACERRTRVTELPGGLRLGTVWAESYRTFLAARLAERLRLDVVAVVNAQTGKVGLRGNRKLDLSAVAARFGGGGHPGAAAFPLAGAGLAAALDGVRERLEQVLAEAEAAAAPPEPRG